MDHTTNYRDTFIVVSPDCPAAEGTVPPKPGTVAAMQHERLLAKPYSLTSDDLLFAIFADRNEVPARDRAVARAEFFSKGQPCMRSSPLVKTYGWGVHHDDKERVAIYPLGSLSTPSSRRASPAPWFRGCGRAAPEVVDGASTWRGSRLPP